MLDPHLMVSLAIFAGLIVFVNWGIPAIIRRIEGSEPAAQWARSNFNIVNKKEK